MPVVRIPMRSATPQNVNGHTTRFTTISPAVNTAPPKDSSARGDSGRKTTNEGTFVDLCSTAIAKISTYESSGEGIELYYRAHRLYECNPVLRKNVVVRERFAHLAYHIGSQLTIHVPNFLQHALECFLLAELYFGASHPVLREHAAVMAKYVRLCVDRICEMHTLADWWHSQQLRTEYSELYLRAHVARSRFALAWQQSRVDARY